MYKIGDKVEYLNNVWEVCDCEVDNVEIYNDKLGVNIYVPISDVQPYRTAHEKLIELWWEEEQETTIKNNKRYDKGNDTIFIDLVKKTYEVYGGYEPCKVDFTLSRILTEYLEELHETPST